VSKTKVSDLSYQDELSGELNCELNGELSGELCGKLCGKLGGELSSERLGADIFHRQIRPQTDSASTVKGERDNIATYKFI